MLEWIVRCDKTHLVNSSQKYFHTRHLAFLIFTYCQILYFSIMEMYLPGEQKRYPCLHPNNNQAY